MIAEQELIIQNCFTSVQTANNKTVYSHSYILLQILQIFLMNSSKLIISHKLHSLKIASQEINRPNQQYLDMKK